MAVVFFGATLGAEIKAQFVDDFDAHVFKPIAPAIGTDGIVNPLAQLFIGSPRRGRQLLSVRSGKTPRPLTAKAIARTAWPGFNFLCNGRRLTQLAEHLGSFIA